MFLGEFKHSLDAKGRVIIPSKFRFSLGEEFVMTKGLDGCLFLFPMDEWRAFEEKLRSLPFANKDARAFVRFFTAGATESAIDKQGRTLIPPNLREHCNIDKDAVIIGTPNRIEIWSEENWKSYVSDENLSYENIAEQMEELGF
ncbi:MAG: division/cell wall cluster transcriptional repressor MraZ [Tissierellia bacterium]|nr:division/cell wall cluster transcriptional repressor MraZ [Tissierellia bacterium]